MTLAEATASAELWGTVRFDRTGSSTVPSLRSGLSLLTVVGYHSPSYDAVH
jgi:hypothetical protein